MGWREPPGKTLAAPPPPIALLTRQLRIFGLSYGTPKDIEHARILPRSCFLLKRSVQAIPIALRQIGNVLHAEQFEIFQHALADTVQVGQISDWHTHNERV